LWQEATNMNFDYNDEQRQFADALGRFVAKDYGFEARKAIVASASGASDSVWKTLAELGVLALPLAGEHGGFDGGAVDLMPVMEAFGDALLVEPYLSTVGLAAQCIARSGSVSQQAAILPLVASGDMKLAFAHAERAARYRPQSVAMRAVGSATGWILDGEKCMVLHGPLADRVVVSARTAGVAGERDGISLFLVDPAAPGVTVKPYRTVDGMPAADMLFSQLALGDDALLGVAGGALPVIEEVFDFATALVCAEAVGAIAYANAQTLEYLKTRRQYRTTIGSFQALQHRMVEMMISHEQAKSMACLVCVKVDTETDPAARSRIVSAAKIRIAQACRLVAGESVQMHGGIGMTDELKLSHTFRRLLVIARQFGDMDYHLARFAQLDRTLMDRAIVV
jgi:alkylation response protein AidB-like acyl-CoA dehydrogenase